MLDFSLSRLCCSMAFLLGILVENSGAHSCSSVTLYPIDYNDKPAGPLVDSGPSERSPWQSSDGVPVPADRPEFSRSDRPRKDRSARADLRARLDLRGGTGDGHVLPAGLG